MKWRFSALAAMPMMLLTGCFPHSKRDTEAIDGGQTHYVNKNAPKAVRSQLITFFYCEFSATDRPLNESAVAGRYYTLYAGENGGSFEARAGGDVFAKRSFDPDDRFFAQLQQIVSKYDLAQYNGEFYTVAGLPPDLGIKLNIRYASDEQIYASDNQSCFLPLQAMEELVCLFNPNDLQHQEQECCK